MSQSPLFLALGVSRNIVDNCRELCYNLSRNRYYRNFVRRRGEDMAECLNCESRTAVYLSPITGTVTEPTGIYPPERKAEIMGVRNPAVRAEKIGTWKLLEFAFADFFGEELADLSPHKTDGGKWICDRYFFSLSHTRGIAAAAVSECEVGVDIESVVSARARLTPERITRLRRKLGFNLCGGDEITAFLAEWTAREAVFKHSGGSLLTPRDGDSTLPIRTGTIALPHEAVISICGEGSRDARIILCDGGKKQDITAE